MEISGGEEWIREDCAEGNGGTIPERGRDRGGRIVGGWRLFQFYENMVKVACK